MVNYIDSPKEILRGMDLIKDNFTYSYIEVTRVDGNKVYGHQYIKNLYQLGYQRINTDENFWFFSMHNWKERMESNIKACTPATIGSIRI